MPVSYTHLDVYKRQELFHEPFVQIHKVRHILAHFRHLPFQRGYFLLLTLFLGKFRVQERKHLVTPCNDGIVEVHAVDDLSLIHIYGQIGYQVFVYDRERHAATFTYDWEKQQIKFSNN